MRSHRVAPRRGRRVVVVTELHVADPTITVAGPSPHPQYLFMPRPLAAIGNHRRKKPKYNIRPRPPPAKWLASMIFGRPLSDEKSLIDQAMMSKSASIVLRSKQRQTQRLRFERPATHTCWRWVPLNTLYVNRKSESFEVYGAEVSTKQGITTGQRAIRERAEPKPPVQLEIPIASGRKRPTPSPNPHEQVRPASRARDRLRSCRGPEHSSNGPTSG